MKSGAVCYLLVIKVKVFELSVSFWYYSILMLKMVFKTADSLNKIRFLNLHDENNFFYAQVTFYERGRVFDYEIEYCWLIQKADTVLAMVRLLQNRLKIDHCFVLLILAVSESFI